MTGFDVSDTDGVSDTSGWSTRRASWRRDHAGPGNINDCAGRHHIPRRGNDGGHRELAAGHRVHGGLHGGAVRKHLLCVSKVASVADLPKPKFEKLFVQAMLKMPVLKDVNADLHEIEQVPPLVLAPL